MMNNGDLPLVSAKNLAVDDTEGKQTAVARKTLTNAGADFVVNRVANVPAIVRQLNNF